MDRAIVCKYDGIGLYSGAGVSALKRGVFIMARRLYISLITLLQKSMLTSILVQIRNALGDGEHYD